ncbi:MAG: phosphatase PAP2 family protein [Clostridia bacterium]|nr:phosphatase PAP2 family protein [Clostridia bacterium]
MLEFIEKTFADFDKSAFDFMSGLREGAGDVLTPVTTILSLLTTLGILYIIIGLCMALFKGKRKLAICLIGAIAIGAIFTNLALKNIVARPRPFDGGYRELWEMVGAPHEDEYSFPSGHTTATTAVAMAGFLYGKKKWSWIGLLAVLVIGFCRIYLVVHYASDVLGGIIVGSVAGLIAGLIVKIFYAIIKNKNGKFARFVKDWDLSDWFVKKKYKEKAE